MENIKRHHLDKRTGECTHVFGGTSLTKREESLIISCLVILSLLASFSLVSQNARGTVVGGVISDDTTWTVLGSPYYVVESLIVNQGVTLAIEPEVEVLFDLHKGIRVFGSLIVNGTENGWVTFAPNATSPYDGYWDGIGIEGGGYLSMFYANISYAYEVRISSSNNEVNHCRISHSDHYALMVWTDSSTSSRADNNTISHCEIIENTYHGGTGEAVLMENSNNNTFESNTVADNSDRLGLRLLDSHNNTILGNLFVDNTASNVWIYDSERNLVANNYMSGGSHGVQIIGSDSHPASFNIIKNNTMVDNPIGGVSLYYNWNRYSVVEDNYISGSRWGVCFPTPGGLITPVENTTIRNNIIVNNTYGFNISATAWNTSIHGNEIAGNDYGIFISSPHKNMIWNNSVSDNTICGLCLEGGRDISMTGNRVENNGIGLSLDLSQENEIAVNIVENNTQWGFRLQSSILNRIYHNDIVNNTQQAYDDSIQSNQWDNGYPSGGNYWSDYTGLDLYSGPNQDVPGSDGIGDDSYVIDVDSQDNYPLTEPTIIPPPNPPTDISAVLIGSNHQDVMISWDLSSDDGVGLTNVIRYDIYRNATYDSGKGYPFYDTVPNGTSSYVDSGAGEGNPSNYFYYVCAVNMAGNFSCSPNQAGKFTRPLPKGPNLISIPLIQSNESIETVLQTVEYDKAWYHDSSSQEWKWHMKHKEYRRGLWNMNHSMGIWVNVTHNSNLTVAGIIPAQTVIHLYEGWNLVSFPSVDASYTVGDMKLSLPVERVEGFDPALPHFLRVLSDSDVFLAGRAYWVKVQADVEWIITFD